MNREEAEKYLHCAMVIGELLLKSGAEVGRVEDTICRICKAYDAERVDVFSITSSIVTTLQGKEFGICTQTCRVSGRSNDLDRLDQLNQLSRNICENKMDYTEIQKELEIIQSRMQYPFIFQLLFYALISGAFSVFFGGDWKDMAASAIIGAVLKTLELLVKQISVNSLITALICSGVGGFLSNFAVWSGIGSHADLISIGNIMLLIPGIALTNSIRDMFCGDTITGLIRFMESVLLALVIALGFTFANFMF